MTEVDKILKVECNNDKVRWVEGSKKKYKIVCKEMDNLLIQYHQLDNIIEKSKLSDVLMIKRREIEQAYVSMELTIKNYGDIVFDGTMMKKQLFSLINEELIQKVMSPTRLMKHLELGGDIEDF